MGYKVSSYRNNCKFQQKSENPKSRRKIIARTSESIEAVRTLVGGSAKKSIRRSQELGISHTSVHKILNVNFRLYPYRIHIKYKLTPGGKVKRSIMCQWFHGKIELPHFLLSRHDNSKNSLLWGTVAPNEVLQKPVYLKKSIALMAISKHGIIGPCWFEGENEKLLTITKAWYI